jgi:hypothetical protein
MSTGLSACLIWQGFCHWIGTIPLASWGDDVLIRSDLCNRHRLRNHLDRAFRPLALLGVRMLITQSVSVRAELRRLLVSFGKRSNEQCDWGARMKSSNGITVDRMRPAYPRHVVVRGPNPKLYRRVPRGQS